MKLVTIATHSDMYFPFLKQSCQYHSSQLEVLGWKKNGQVIRSS